MNNKEEIFKNIEKHLMEDEKPSLYFNSEELQEHIEDYPFKMLGDLKKIDQSPKYHPEGSVWNHTFMVVDKAATMKDKSKDSRAFMWAALLHDLGKVPTTKVRKGRITSYDHDKMGEHMAYNFLKEFTGDEAFIYKVSKLVRWHMQPLFVLKDLPFAEIDKMISEVDMDDLVLLFLCDRLGRGQIEEEKINDEKNNALQFIEKVRKYNGSK